MVNLFLAGVYDSFMLHSSIKDKSKNVQKDKVEPVELKKNETNFFLNLGQITKKESSPSISLKKQDETERETDLKKEIITSPYKATYIEASSVKIYYNVWREKVLTLFHKIWFRRFISMLILADIVVLCCDGHPISRSSLILINKLDFSFFCIFFIEITIRLSVIRLKQLKASWLLWIDIIVIYANFCVLLYEFAHGFNIFEEGSLIGIGVKTMKMIRIFRIIYYCSAFSSLSFLMRALAKTLGKMKHFLLIMLVLMVVFALIGMRLFGQRARFIDTNGGGLIYDM